MLGSYVARLGSVWMRNVGKERVPPLGEVRFPLRIWPTDVDVYLHVNNGRYLTLMDFGRFVFSVRTGMLTEATRRGWVPVLGAATIYFWRELRTFARVELVTRIAAYDGKWIYFEHRFEKDGAIHALAIARGVFKHKGRTVAPAELLATMGYTDPPPPIPEHIQRWIEAEPPRDQMSTRSPNPA